MKNTIEFILESRIQSIFENCAKSFNLSFQLYTPDGRILNLGRRRSRYCQIIQEKICSYERCLASDNDYLEKCQARRDIIDYECYAGVIEGIAPIILDGESAGYVMLGQFRTHDVLPPEILNRCPVAYREELLEAYQELPVLSREQIKALVSVLAVFIDYIVERDMVIIRENARMYAFRKWLESHCTEPLSVDDAAKKLQCSRSTVTHKLKTKLGYSFQELLIELRLQKAEKLLGADEFHTVAEAAAAAGYADAAYFSRLYRRYRGFAPSQYRERQIR